MSMSGNIFVNSYTTVGPVRKKLVCNKLPEDASELLIKALGPGDDKPNTVAVYVGGPTVTANFDSGTGGFTLAPGESITVPPSLAESLHVVATSNEQVVAWLVK